jgi:hypothetical protein
VKDAKDAKRIAFDSAETTKTNIKVTKPLESPRLVKVARQNCGTAITHRFVAVVA